MQNLLRPETLPIFPIATWINLTNQNARAKQPACVVWVSKLPIYPIISNNLLHRRRLTIIEFAEQIIGPDIPLLLLWACVETSFSVLGAPCWKFVFPPMHRPKRVLGNSAMLSLHRTSNLNWSHNTQQTMHFIVSGLYVLPRVESLFGGILLVSSGIRYYVFRMLQISHSRVSSCIQDTHGWVLRKGFKCPTHELHMRQLAQHCVTTYRLILGWIVRRP